MFIQAGVSFVVTDNGRREELCSIWKAIHIPSLDELKISLIMIGKYLQA